jgi:hypothetical protein
VTFDHKGNHISAREVFEYILRLIELLRPKFYNRITWVIVIAGLTLMSTPFWEKVLDAILKKQFDISISGPNDIAWGFALCILVLTYHFLNSGIYDALRSRSTYNREVQELEHYKAIFKTANFILTEQQLEWVLSQLETDHSYRLDQGSKLDNFCRTLAATENTFICPKLDATTKSLLSALLKLRSFTSYQFVVFPHHQVGDDFRLCMAPALNCDREGDHSPGQMKQYDVLTDQLLVDDVREKYKAFRMCIKREIVV